MRVSTAVCVIAMVPVAAAAQQFLANVGPHVDPNTRFEVAVIKAVADTNGQVLMRMAPGRFESSVPVGVLLRQALQKPDYQIVGAPGWMDTQRYSIIAKPPEGVPPTAISVMLANLLKDRFQLATHLETREQPIYHLVLARADGRLGPELKRTSAECQAIITERIAAAQAAAAGRGGPPPLPTFPGPNDPLPCGFARIPVGLVAASGRTIAEFARGTLSDLAGRPVIDKTGLTGMYDFTLKYAPDGRVAGPLGLISPPPLGAPAQALDPDAPSLFVALQEQLGLKLENARGPVEVVVIDRMEQPTLD
jgi:uncharacterized protein (TIGR03435 family)